MRQNDFRFSSLASVVDVHNGRSRDSCPSSSGDRPRIDVVEQALGEARSVHSNLLCTVFKEVNARVLDVRIPLREVCAGLRLSLLRRGGHVRLWHLFRQDDEHR